MLCEETEGTSSTARRLMSVMSLITHFSYCPTKAMKDPARVIEQPHFFAGRTTECLGPLRMLP